MAGILGDISSGGRWRGVKPVPMPDPRRRMPEGWVPKGPPPMEMPDPRRNERFPKLFFGRWYNKEEWEALQKRMREHRRRQSESYRRYRKGPPWISLMSNPSR